MSKPKIKTIRIKAGEPIPVGALPAIPAFNPEPFACAIAALRHEVRFWEIDLAVQPKDPDYAKKVMADCEAAIEVLQREQAGAKLLKKIFNEEGAKVLPTYV